jgi:hypothetical protein
MEGKLRHFNPLQSPYISIVAKVIQPGTTNGKPNIKNETKYVLAPSAKKIGTYIRNQLFGSDLLTQTEGLDINWLMPTLGEALELSVYEKESFIYLHRFQDKVYLECIKKCDVHNLVQMYDKIISCDLIHDFETNKAEYSLQRHIKILNGTSIITFTAFRKSDSGKWEEIPLSIFNNIFETKYKKIHNLPYEVMINIDTGQDFFKDSEKFLNEEMEVYNVLCDEIQKTKTRIATTQHYQSGDIYNQWQPSANMYDVKTISVGGIQDLFTLLPGDKEHSVFEFLQGDIRVQQYIDTFKFCDYQVIQMANLSPATFGYEKDTYQNTTSVNLSANLSEMTIEAIKKQITPQINHLLENIIKLQELIGSKDKIPNDLQWDFGTNELIDDNKKITTLQAIQRTMSVPYSTRAKILAPIINKLIDEKTSADDLFNNYKLEREDIKLNYEEF